VSQIQICILKELSDPPCGELGHNFRF